MSWQSGCVTEASGLCRVTGDAGYIGGRNKPDSERRLGLPRALQVSWVLCRPRLTDLASRGPAQP
jgi:hypothetical protein